MSLKEIFTKTDGYLQYRYGKPNAKLELMYPESKQHPANNFVFKNIMYSGGGNEYIKFNIGNISYLVFSYMTHWRDEVTDKAGVIITKSDKQIANISCLYSQEDGIGMGNEFIQSVIQEDKEDYEANCYEDKEKCLSF